VYSLYVLEDITIAAAECDRFLNRFPDCGEFHLLRGAIAYEDERYDDAYGDFMKALALLDEDSREAYDEMRLVFSYRENDSFLASAFDDQAVTERAYWIQQDPDPTTEVNERHLEHIYRVFLADVHFSVARPETRGWDTERGEAMIKFGWPLAIETSLGDSWKDGRQEMWNYVIDGRFHQFLFVDERLNGNMRVPYAADLKLSFMRHSTRETDYLPETVLLPGDLDLVAFRDDDFSSSILLALRVDADSMRSTVDIEKVDQFHLRGAFFDDEWISDHRFADTLWTSDVPLVYSEGRFAYDLVRTVRMPFDYYHFACTFEDEWSVTTAQFKSDGDTYRFAGDGLAVSDILVQSPSRDGATVIRGDRRLYPNPGHIYRHGERLSVYFESPGG
jgi:GWxTD domain-containing protein